MDRLDDESREAFAAEFLLQRVYVVKWNCFGLGQKRPETFPPEVISHERQGSASQAMERSVRIQQTVAPGVRARQLDGGLDAFTPGTRKESLGQLSACAPAQLLSQFSSCFGHMGLNHGRTTALQFFAKRRNDRGMVVPNIVNAVTGEKIENASSVRSEQFRPRATFITDIHLQQIQ